MPTHPLYRAWYELGEDWDPNNYEQPLCELVRIHEAISEEWLRLPPDERGLQPDPALTNALRTRPAAFAIPWGPELAFSALCLCIANGVMEHAPVLSAAFLRHAFATDFKHLLGSDHVHRPGLAELSSIYLQMQGPGLPEFMIPKPGWTSDLVVAALREAASIWEDLERAREEAPSESSVTEGVLATAIYARLLGGKSQAAGWAEDALDEFTDRPPPLDWAGRSRLMRLLFIYTEATGRPPKPADIRVDPYELKGLSIDEYLDWIEFVGAEPDDLVIPNGDVKWHRQDSDAAAAQARRQTEQFAKLYEVVVAGHQLQVIDRERTDTVVDGITDIKATLAERGERRLQAERFVRALIPAIDNLDDQARSDLVEAETMFRGLLAGSEPEGRAAQVANGYWRAFEKTWKADAERLPRNEWTQFRELRGSADHNAPFGMVQLERMRALLFNLGGRGENHVQQMAKRLKKAQAE